VAEGGFLEWAEFLGELYGTPTPHAPAGKDVVLEIDLQGAEQIRARYPEAEVILVVPPSRAEQEARLRHRGDSEDRIRQRLELAEVEEARGKALADHIVVNDDLSRAVADVAGIIKGRRNKQRETS
jgi:guanylate kinase